MTGVRVETDERFFCGPCYFLGDRGARTKRKIKHGKERNLLMDESANLGQQG